MKAEEIIKCLKEANYGSIGRYRIVTEVARLTSENALRSRFWALNGIEKAVCALSYRVRGLDASHSFHALWIVIFVV